MRDKMIPLSIFFHSKNVYQILSHLFILPSKSTLLSDLQMMNMKNGFSESVLDALKVKVNTMDARDCNVKLILEEMSIKQRLIYNTGSDVIEGFEDFGHVSQTRYIANHAFAFMVRGSSFQVEMTNGIFLKFQPNEV